MKHNWEIKKLGDVCEIARGGSPRPIKEYITTDNDGINWIKIGDTDPSGKYIYYTAEKIKPSGLSKSRYVEEGDFLLSNSMSFGRPYILKTNGCIHDGWLVLKNYNRSLLIDFFYYMLLSPYIQEQFELEAKGSTVRNLNTDIVSNVKIVVPPLSDQHRIVSILDEKFSQIETLKSNAQKNLDNAEQLWKAQLEKQFDNQKWEKKKLGEVAKVSSSKRIYADELSPSGVPFLRVSDVVSRINGTETCDLYIPEEKYLSFFDKGLVPKENDVLVTSRGTLGLCYIIKSTDRFYFQDGMITWLALKNDINPKFIYYLFDSQIIKKQIETKAAGAAVSYISIADIKNFEIPIPPLAEQERIVKELDALSAKINTLKANYRRQIECCDELRQSLLKKAFEGEL